jgi:DNA-directed RNA polymerase specialized sigma24 family protein
MSQQDEGCIKLLINRYEKKIFALVLSLIGGNKDKAYDIATSSFAEALPLVSPLDNRETSLSKIAGIAFEKCRQSATVPSFDAPFVLDLPPEQKELLRIVNTALQALPFETKASLLLRDQIHLPYRNISGIMQTSENATRVMITKARIELRKKIEELLGRGG